MSTGIDVTVDEVDPEITYALRGAVLRPDGGAIVWAGDEDRTTFHLAARAGDRVVGVVRFSPVPCPWRPLARSAWQLRGMATEPDVRGSGVGKTLIVEGLARVAERGGDVVWCDARVSAIGFYERMGFTVVTDEFEKTGIGPHVGMLIDVPPATAPRSS